MEMQSESAYYKVAGLCFCLQGPVPQMANLAPFRCEKEDPLLFTLELVRSMPLVSATPVFCTQDGPGFPEIAIDKLSDGNYRFRMRPLPGEPVAAELRANESFTRAQLLLLEGDTHFAINNSLMLLYAFSSACKGVLEMHSSVVVNGGRGYLFLGKSGTGKSTHSSLWLKHIPGTMLLNDDNPILRLMPDGTARVFGSPWSGKTPCYKNLDFPAGAVVRIRQAPFNKIEKLPPVQAYASLMASASSFRPFSELADGWHHTLEGLAASLPCYTLDCLPDQAAAELCHKTVCHG